MASERLVRGLDGAPSRGIRSPRGVTDQRASACVCSQGGGTYPGRGARRRVVGLVALLIAAALAVTGLLGASAASAVATGGGRGPIRVLAPRAGTVIVARTRAGAKGLRVGATLSISRPVGGLSARLNGHPVRLPAIRSGRLAVRLGAANGLAVGENVLQVSAGRSGGRPRWVVPARFFVGYRDARILSVRLRQAVGKKLPAASAVLRVPRAGVRSLIVTLNGTRVQVPAGARLLDLARSGALRRGSNRLRVQLLMTDGRIGELARTFSAGSAAQRRGGAAPRAGRGGPHHGPGRGSVTDPARRAPRRWVPMGAAAPSAPQPCPPGQDPGRAHHPASRRARSLPDRAGGGTGLAARL